MTSSNYFAEHGLYLVAKTANPKLDDDDLRFVRQWLDDAPSMAQSSDMPTMAAWGMLMGRLASHSPDATPTHSTSADALRLLAYLNTMAEMPLEDWWASGVEETEYDEDGDEFEHTPKPVYDAFLGVWNRLAEPKLNHHTHALLHHLATKTEWTPDITMKRLHQTYGRQIEYASVGPRGLATIRDTAKGSFLQALRPLLLDTPWRPRNPDVYGNMWAIHDYAAGPAWDLATREKAFAKTLLAALPSETDKALRGLLNSSQATQHHVDVFFPLRLRTCAVEETLDALIELVNKRKGKGTDSELHPVAVEMKVQLKKYHPDIASMLDVHATMFPEATAGNTFSSTLLHGFKTLLGRYAPEVTPLPVDAFEDSPGM